jgi:tetratricopeptide (TPR) repeat protein
VKIPPEGRIGTTALETLLGMLGAVRATGVVDLKRKKLVRRLVLEQGVIRAILSNANEDRFFEWLLSRGELADLGQDRIAALREALGTQPLAAGFLVAHGALPADRAQALLLAQAGEILTDVAGASDTTFEVRAGRLDLGLEPAIGWPAAAAAVLLARGRARQRGPAVPARVVTVLDPADEGLVGALGLSDDERAVLFALAQPLATAELPKRVVPVAPAAARAALELLVRAGLVEAPARAEAGGDEEPLEEVDEQAIKRWLAAAAAENLPELVGCAPGATPTEARRGYYRTVRRFHPDRFRQGPYAGHYKEIENAFRLLHEAIEVMTDPQARARWEKQKKGPEVVPPARIARRLYEQARELAGGGRRLEALETLERAWKTDASDPRIGVAAALLLFGNPRRRPEAIERLATLARTSPGSADVLGALALCLSRAGRDVEARSWLAKARRDGGRELVVRVAAGEPAALAAARKDPFLAPLLGS